MPRLGNMNGKIADALQRHEREKEPRHQMLDLFRRSFSFFFPSRSLSLRVSERNEAGFFFFLPLTSLSQLLEVLLRGRGQKGRPLSLSLHGCPIGSSFYLGGFRSI